MNQRRLGTTDVWVSEISLGCWTLGGLNWVDGSPNGWANVDEAEAVAAVHLALDQGVNHFDNADVYGNGRAERLLARALGSKSQSVVIASKVGHFKGTAEHAYDPLHIRHQCEQSLQNLRRDYLDIYYFHHGDFGPEDRALDAALETMQRLRQEGKFRLLGLSAYSEADFLRLVPKIEPDVLQSWAHALDDRFIRPDAPVARLMAERGLPFVAFSPLAQGILLDKYDPERPPSFEAGDTRKGNARFAPEFLRELQPKLERLKSRFGSRTEDLARVALQYVLHFAPVACVIPGFRNERQVRTNLAATGRPLSAEDVKLVAEALT
jgi:aryl-alcohol dehydrogenase-like predicted oxidoreductase